MSQFSVNILGCGSATPSLRHLPSCQVVDYRGTLFMIDCGEGAQLQMRRMRLRFSHLRHIFISHLHGDHFLGLPGLLSTLSLHDTTGQIHVYMFPKGIKLLQEILGVFMHQSSVEIVYHPIEYGTATIYEDDALTVSTFPLYHRVQAVGYLFREKPHKRPLRADMIEFFDVPVAQRNAIKLGADFVRPDGTVIENARLTYEPEPAVSYAYCSDTMFDPRVAEAVRDVDVLYHEATYADDKADKAAARGHSTARQAGRIAAMAGVSKLVIGHYSKSYDSDEPLLSDAIEEFPNTVAATEGLTIKID